MVESEFKLKVGVDDADFQKFLASLSIAPASAGKKLSEGIKEGIAAADNITKKHHEDDVKSEEDAEKAKENAVRDANNAKANAEERYLELKHEYVLKGLDATRQAIHEEEQAVKQSRDALAEAVRSGVSKEGQAVIKGERDKQNARLQGLRSVEKEITGARTFTEQLEKNVYGPINEKEKAGGALSLLLFGEVGSLKKAAAQAEAAAKEAEAKAVATAQESQNKIAAMEQAHAAKIKEIESQIAAAKSEEEKKELAAKQAAIQKEIEEEKKLTKAKQAEEQLQLEHKKSELNQEAEAAKAEHAKAKEESQKPGEEKGKGMGLVGGLIGGAAITGSIEIFSKLAEKSKEVADAQHQLQAGTGLTGKALEEAGKKAEEIGTKLGVSGNEAQAAMGKVAAATGATGQELEDQTAAVIAYGQAHGKSAEAVAKLMATEQGRAKVFAEAKLNEAKAQEAANNPAVKAQLIQAKLMDTVGKLAGVLLNALSPVMDALMPIIDSLGDTVGNLLKPALAAVTPVLVALTPLLQLVGTLAGQLLTPVLKILSGIIQFLVNVAIQPLVKWLGEEVPKAVQKMIGVIKGAIDAVKGAVNAVGSFLGLGSKAVAAEGKAANDQQQQNADQLAQQKAIQQGQAEQRDEEDLKHKLTLLKLSGAEESRLRQMAQDEGDDATLTKLDAFDKKREAAAAKGAKAAVKAGFDAAKQAADDAFEQQKTDIALQVSQNQLTEEQGREEELKATKKHAEDLLAATDKYHKDHKAAVLAELNAEKALQKAYYDESIKAEQDNLSDKADALLKSTEVKKLIAAKQLEDGILSDSQYQQALKDIDHAAAEQGYQDKLASLNRELDSAKAHGQSLEAIKKQISAAEKAHDLEAIKEDEETANRRAKIQQELAKSSLDALYAQKEDEITTLQNSGASQDVIIQKQHDLELEKENDRYAQLKKDRASDLDDSKMGQALAASFEADHEAKMNAIDKKAFEERRKDQLAEAQFLSGPFTSGFQKMAQMGFEAVNKFTAGWANSKNVLTATFGTILSGFVSMIEQMVEKILANAAIFALLSIIPGGGLTGGLLSSPIMKGVIPGFAGGTDSTPPGIIKVGENGPELLVQGGGHQIISNSDMNSVVPLSASRAQAQSAVEFGSGLAALGQKLDNIHGAVSQQKTVLPMNRTFENARNNFLYSQSRVQR